MINQNEMLINALPKPETLEEQYIYALVCSVAEVEPKYGIKDGEPFKRMEKYWKMFYQVASEKFKDLETPATNKVNSAAIQSNAVTTTKIADKNITVSKLADNVKNRLLPESTTGYITEAMLNSSVANKLLGDGRVTEAMLSANVDGKLLGEKKVTKNMLSQEVQDILARVK